MTTTEFYLIRINRLLYLFLVIALLGCNTQSSDSPPENVTPSIPFEEEGTLIFFRDGEEIVTIVIEVADTDSARTRGLMQRSSLPERSGMLFIFDREEPQSFWMANTPLSLDIMFVSADSQIVHIAKYTKPLSPQSVESRIPARFVIETPAGFTDTYGITESDRVSWEYTPRR